MNRTNPVRFSASVTALVCETWPERQDKADAAFNSFPDLRTAIAKEIS